MRQSGAVGAWVRAWGLAAVMASGGGVFAADGRGLPAASPPAASPPAALPPAVSSPAASPPAPGAIPVVVHADGDPGVTALAPAAGQSVKRSPPSLLRLPRQDFVPTDTVFWLQPDAKRGGYVWKGAGFRARISGDGELSFEDTHLMFKLTPVLLGKPNPYSVPSLQSKVLGRPSPYHGLSEIVPRPEEIFTGYQSRYHADPREAERIGKERLDYGSNVPIVMVTAGFDLTDELMRLNGQDPYRYDKARFAVSTRPFREKLAARARNVALRDACGRLRASLAHLAAAPPPTPASFAQAVRSLAVDLDAATEEGRALRAYLDGLAREGGGVPPSVAEPMTDDDPRLCGLVAFPAASARKSGGPPPTQGAAAPTGAPP